jgi:transketolase
MLLYALLHLTGYALPIGELQAFRQLHSLTPGHPEVGLTPGVETTTGPLGQGLANAVGMALAEKLLGDEFNRPGHTDRRPPHLGLLRRRLPDGRHQPRGLFAGRRTEPGKLVVLYDDNGISIDGDGDAWFADDTPARFAPTAGTSSRTSTGTTSMRSTRPSPPRRRARRRR